MWVFIYCCWYGIPLRGILHDWDKFLPYTAHHYSTATFGPGRTINYGLKGGMPDIELIGKTEFYKSVKAHKRNNKHHPEHWCGDEMDRDSLFEMIADWKAANKLHKDHFSVESWYNINKDKLVLHPKTRRLVEYILNRGL